MAHPPATNNSDAVLNFGGYPSIHAHFRHIQSAMSRLNPVLPRLKMAWRIVRESHRAPLTGVTQPPKLVGPHQLGVTFIGHSSFLLQIAGRNVLIDPVFSRYLMLLRRQRRAGLRIADLPPIHAVLLSHAHMDHLNFPSLRRIIRHTRRATGTAPVVIVPRNVADLVARLGFSRIIELDWWQSTKLDGVTVTMTPAQHWGARMFKDTHRQYGGYVLSGAGHSVYHSGDTAYFNGFRQIGERLQPKVALLPIGAYYPDSFRGVHTSPEDALQAYLDLGTARTFIPMHFGTFPLGQEPMSEPPVRLRVAAQAADITSQIRILGEGETFIS